MSEPVACPACDWQGVAPDWCPTHQVGYRLVAENPPEPSDGPEPPPPAEPLHIAPDPDDPIGLDAPAEPDRLQTALDRVVRLEANVRALRGKLAQRDNQNVDHFDRGVQYGRDSERRSLADRLETNAETLTHNGSGHDRVVRTVLRALAAQIRADLARERKTG